jgi:hypothetical protein
MQAASMLPIARLSRNTLSIAPARIGKFREPLNHVIGKLKYKKIRTVAGSRIPWRTIFSIS